jgi:hypothetical protein
MESIQRQLRELVPDTHGEHCLVDFRVVCGKPVEEILRVGQATRANLIVMGAKKRTSLAGHVPHTTAFAVVSSAACPVLTVRSRQSGAWHAGAQQQQDTQASMTEASNASALFSVNAHFPC